VVFEDLFRAVAVMDVPVEDHHAPCTAAHGMPRGHGDVIDHAETHALRGPRVVPGRAHQAEAIVGDSVDQRIGQRQRRARGTARRRIRARAEEGVGIEVTALSLDARERIDVL
jgi:hypothetical protein